MLKLLPIFLLFVLSCTPDHAPTGQRLEGLSQEEREQLSQKSMKEALAKEQRQIHKFIKRKGGDFIESNTGVHYYIYQNQNKGQKCAAGNRINLMYSLKLLNGKNIRKKGTIETITLDYDDKASGLHECLSKMKKGEKAIVIIPSHRAHGFSGNDTDIPSLSTLVYDLEIKNIK